MKFINDYNLLEDLQWVLLTGSIKMRRDTIWILQNTACSERGAEVIMESGTNIWMNVLLEVKRKDIEMKTECFLFLANLLENLNGKPHHYKKLVSQNLLGVIHDELYEGPDYPYNNILAIECLAKIFRVLPDEQDKFLRVHGTEALE